MSRPDATVTAAEARHLLAELLHDYTAIADRKDVAAATQLFGDAVVRFPHGGYDRAAQAPSFWRQLWSSPSAHRHDVTNLRVRATPEAGWQALAHYTRWVLDPEPELATLGEYELRATVTGGRARPVELQVTRTWTRPAP